MADSPNNSVSQSQPADAEKSMAQIIAELSPDERAAILEGYDVEQLLWDWEFWARPSQTAPDGDWLVWLIMAGRGFGKSRSGAEWVREQVKYTNRGRQRVALVGRTTGDARDVMVEGPSGIMNVSPPSELPDYEPSKRRLTWPSGAVGTTFSADEPSLLRGPEFDLAWADELAAWRRMPDDSGLTAWDNLRFATRRGNHPRILATTTPKRSPVMRALIAEAEENPGRVQVTHGSTLENVGNISPDQLAALMGVYKGTNLELQELFGQMLGEQEGALWTEEILEDTRLGILPNGAPLRCVGVDPSVAERPTDECGIVVCAATAERDLYKRRGWILEDASILGSPDVWAQRVVEVARKWGCPVVAEVNQGGALIKQAIQTIDPSIKVLEVHSKYGKQLRAEPVVMAYQQKRIYHVGYMAELESQMLNWIPGEGHSPDRIDALVHALTALMIKPPAGFMGGHISARSAAVERRIPRQTFARGVRSKSGRGFTVR